MKLGEAFANEEHNRKQGAYCTMGSLLESLNEEDRQTLNDVMGDYTWTGVRIANVLQQQGYKIGYWVVNRHRSGMCQC